MLPNTPFAQYVVFRAFTILDQTQMELVCSYIYFNLKKNSHRLMLMYLGIMPHCVFGDVMDKSNVQIFNGSNWEEEIKIKNHIKMYSDAN